MYYFSRKKKAKQKTEEKIQLFLWLHIITWKRKKVTFECDLLFIKIELICVFLVVNLILLLNLKKKKNLLQIASRCKNIRFGDASPAS